MKNKLLFITALFYVQLFNVYSQRIQTLSGDCNDPIYTTYAAPIERTDYKLDQAHEMQWSNPQELLGFSSEKGDTIALAFQSGDKISDELIDYEQKPVISRSFSDIMQMDFVPFPGIEIKACFDVYSSTSAILEMQITNTNYFATDLTTCRCKSRLIKYSD